MLDRIRVLVLDVDGVLTDGRIVYTDDGAELKRFDVRDGHGLKLWMRSGHEAGILSGRASAAVRRRAEELGITAVWEGAKDKLPVLGEALERFACSPEEIAYMGDDLPDLPVMARVGFAVAPADAIAEAQRMAHYVSRAPGGRGAVREVVELILRHQGRWGAAMGRYRDRMPPELPPARNPWRDPA